jgi:hypothetical protein
MISWLSLHPRRASRSACSLMSCPAWPGIHCIIILCCSFLRNSSVWFENAQDTVCEGWALVFSMLVMADELSEKKCMVEMLGLSLQY